MIGRRPALPIPNLVVSFDELTGGIFLENNSSARSGITCGINIMMHLKRTEAAHGSPSEQMQVGTRQASEDGGFCFFTVKNSSNSDTSARR